jgi:hypothetical protein
MNNEQIQKYRYKCIKIFWKTKYMSKYWSYFIRGINKVTDCRNGVWRNLT